MPVRNPSLLNLLTYMAHGMGVACCLGLAGVSLAQTSAPWSGRIAYRVEPLTETPEHWDYLPRTVVYETNGQEWRIAEEGTSFERIWLGAHDADAYYVLFHFLGHAVELLEPCPMSGTSTETGDPTHPQAPCPWIVPELGERMVLNDGPARYELVQANREVVDASNWPSAHFEVVSGYEPMDKMGLAALLSRLEGKFD